MLRHKIQKHQFVWQFLDTWETAFLFYDNYNCANFVKLGFDASPDYVELDYRLMFQYRKGLAVHNHPDDGLEPSEADWEYAKYFGMYTPIIEYGIITPSLGITLYKVENGCQQIITI